MKTFHVTLLMLALVVAGTLTSCSIEEDDLIENPTYATGGELDDPVEPDRDDE